MGCGGSKAMPPMPEESDDDRVFTPRGVTPDKVSTAGTIVLSPESDRTNFALDTDTRGTDLADSSMSRNSMLEWVKDVWTSRSSQVGWAGDSRPNLWRSSRSNLAGPEKSPAAAGVTLERVSLEVTAEEAEAEADAEAQAPAHEPSVPDASDLDESVHLSDRKTKLEMLQVTTMDL